MVHSNHEAEDKDRHRQEAEDADRQAHRYALAETPEGDEQAQVGEDPYFPDLDTAIEANQAALAAAGQTNHALLRPEVLEGALGRAQNYWYYEASLAKAAAALAHGVGQAQAFEDGNKRTAYWLTHHFLHENGLGHAAPDDDTELADHLVGFGEGTHSMEDTAAMLERRLGQQRQANILDPAHDELDVRVWDAPDAPEPVLKQAHRDWILRTVYDILAKHGYDGMENWASLVLTGSLTTYQYSDESDCDVSLFVNSEKLPEWSRAEMIGVMISEFDTVTLPGTPHPMQCFVVARGIAKEDLYKPGLRSGYDIDAQQWIVPPDRNRVYDVEREMNEAYTIALENADKMERLLRYEPQKAVMFWHQIHQRRMRDQKAGKGDYSPSNITYKFLANRGLFPKIEEASGEHIAAAEMTPQEAIERAKQEHGILDEDNAEARSQQGPYVVHHELWGPTCVGQNDFADDDAYAGRRDQYEQEFQKRLPALQQQFGSYVHHQFEPLDDPTYYYDDAGWTVYRPDWVSGEHIARVSNTVTLYHGTKEELVPQILQQGLRSDRSGIFLTDSVEAAKQYGPVVLAVTVPAMRTQPNGTPAPPFFHDDWHGDSGMPGQAWEYDAPIPPESIQISTE